MIMLPLVVVKMRIRSLEHGITFLNEILKKKHIEHGLVIFLISHHKLEMSF